MVRLKKLFVKFLWFLLYATPILLGVSYIAGIQVRKMAIEAINEELNVRVDIHNVHISGIFAFPNVGIDLVNLQIAESEDIFVGDFLRAGEVRLEFNVLDLIAGKQEIAEILIRNAKIQVYQDAKGNTNYEILKPSENTDSTDNNSDLALDLKKIRLQNCHIIYRNDDEKQYFDFRVFNAKASMKMAKEKLAVALKTDGYINRSISGGQPFMTGKSFDVDIDLTHRSDIASYAITKAVVGIESLYVDVKGDILVLEQGPDIDLTMEGRNVNIENIGSILPYDISENLKRWNSTGILELKGFVKGIVSEHDFPTVQIDFGLDKGSVKNEETNLEISSLTLSGDISNSSIDQSDLALSLKVDELVMPSSKLYGTLDIAGFNTPGMDVDIRGKLSLKDLGGMLEGDNFNELAGFATLNLRGKIPWDKKANDFDYRSIGIRGDVEIKNGIIDVPDYPIRDLSFSGRVAGDEISDTKLAFKMYDSDVFFDGKINSWVGYVFSDKRLKLNGKLASQKLDLDRILAGDPADSNEVAVIDTTQSEVDIDLGIDADVQVAAQEFKWLDLTMKEVQGNLVFTEKAITTNMLNLDLFDGNIKLQGGVHAYINGFTVDARAKTKLLNIKQIFDQFDNFGQEDITGEHIAGLLTADIDMRFETDKYFNPISKTFYALTDIEITQGRLRNYKPLESLSTFVEVSELQDIAFSDLKNEITIKDEVIDIPMMMIRSTAIDLEISGTHTFDNYMDYKLVVNLTDLLASKSGWLRKKKEKKLEKGENGGLRAYVVMSGTPDDLHLAYDKDAVKQKIREEAREERREFFQDLKKELRGQRIFSGKDKEVNWDE